MGVGVGGVMGGRGGKMGRGILKCVGGRGDMCGGMGEKREGVCVCV